MNEGILSIVAHVANTRISKNEWILWSNDSKNCEKNIFFSFKYRITDFLEFSHYFLVLSCTFVSTTFHITIVVVCAAIVTHFFSFIWLVEALYGRKSMGKVIAFSRFIQFFYFNIMFTWFVICDERQ